VPLFSHVGLSKATLTTTMLLANIFLFILQGYDYAADGCKGSEGDAGDVAGRDGAVASDYLG
jgi:hypothetical protein